MKRLLAMLLAAGLIAGSAAGVQAQSLSLSEETAMTETEAPVSAFYEEDAYADITVRSMEDAAAVVAGVTGELGGDERIRFEPWRTVTDTAGNSYYVFRQMYDNVTVSGGAVKVVTDPSGKVLGVNSSVETVLPDTETEEGISAEEAVQVVIGHQKKAGQAEPEILEEYTEKIILPVNLELDPYSEEEKEEVRFVWAVYTGNEKTNMTERSELPYLANYVTMDGEYLYSLPTIIPADEAGTTGYQASYMFEFMEPAPYTGTVTLSDGTEQEISVTLMRDSRTGMYYLGNPERRIVVADCYEFLYNKGNIVLEASPDNSGWDNTCLLSLYNYCRAWDYYNEIGWKGGDGLGTPMMILKDFCDKEHEPINNAAYAGSYYGWQLFLSSAVNDFSQCLDVLAHEFTHCVTGSVMTYNAYMNDYGAINEALSDIQGNLCEMMNGATKDTTWLLGENGKQIVRSMSDPHAYNQPEYTWDVHYKPKVKTPTEINDRGGVHTNSSLLNRIAYQLCTEGGMTYEEARAFWFAVDCSMVPGTDYVQLSTLMPWVLRNLGYEQYLPSLEKAIADTGIGSSAAPESFDKERSLVTLELPDTEDFADGNWALYILSTDREKLEQRVQAILNKEGEYADALSELDEMLQDTAWKYLFEDAGEEAFLEVLQKWMQQYLDGMFYFGSGAAGADGRTVQMVCTPGYTIPILMYMKVDPMQNYPSGFGLAVFVKGRWTDLIDLGMEMSGEIENQSADKEPQDLSWLFSDEGDFFYEIRGGETCVIPSEGLENVHPQDADILEKVSPSGEAD